MGAATAAMCPGPAAPQLPGPQVTQLGRADRPLVPREAEPVFYLQGGQVDHEHARRTGAHGQDEQGGANAHGQLDARAAGSPKGGRPKAHGAAKLCRAAGIVRGSCATNGRTFAALNTPGSVERGLEPLELVEKVHDGGVEPLGVDIGDGGHFEVDIEVKLSREVRVRLAVAEDAEVEDLLAATEKAVPVLTTVRAQVTYTEITCTCGK